MYVDTSIPPKPILRGRLHQVAFLASVAGLIWLVHEAPTPRARTEPFATGGRGYSRAMLANLV